MKAAGDEQGADFGLEEVQIVYESAVKEELRESLSFLVRVFLRLAWILLLAGMLARSLILATTS